MKPKIKNILILVLIFILGFGVGMTVTFHLIIARIEAHGLKLLM